MPIVGMRRRTRVFGTRVLRSGKRLCSRQGGGKHREAVDAGAGHGELWIDLFNNPNSGGGNFNNEIQSNVDQSMENEPQNGTGLEQETVEMDIDASKVENGDDNKRDRMWGYVYQRKRKRVDAMSVDSVGSSQQKNRAFGFRRYGKQFVRKRRVKKTDSIRSSLSNGGVCSSESNVLTVAVRSSSSWFACVLTSVLRYMRGTELKMSQLSAFLLSEPISQVFSSAGISFHYALDSGCIKSSGMCNIYEARCSIPLFDMDFSAVPSCFSYLHSSLHLRPTLFTYLHASSHLRPTHSHLDVVACSKTMNSVITEVVEHQQCSSVGDSLGTKAIVSAIDASEKKTNLSRMAIEAPKVTGRLSQFKNGVNFHFIQKKKRSLRCRRIKRLSVIIHNPDESNGSSVSNLFESRDNGTTKSSALSGQQQRTSSQKGSTPTMKEMKTLLVELTQNIDSLSCSANVLVTESHICYRINDAIIKLEILPSKQWVIAVKKDETTRFSLNAQKVMRPCSNNRVTHDIMWTEDTNNWKLEFLNRLDWMIFKELYRECFDRNLQAQNANVVFVPGVHTVTDYTDYSSVPFRRPMSYMSVKADEVSRALVRRTANYDMDSEDEEWLQKLNMKLLGENVGWSNVSEENFELIIDSFEKASYCSPDDMSNEKAQSLCVDLERKEVIEAVYGYWVEKRKLKGVALLRVFQPYKASRDRLLSKPVLRKKRSYKHQSTFTGRGKRLNLLQATTMLHTGVEQEVKNPLSPSNEPLTARKLVEAKKRMLKGRETKTAAIKPPPVPLFNDVLTSQKATKTAAIKSPPVPLFNDASTSQKATKTAAALKVVSRARATRAAADRSESLAIEKRRKAQFLMENADLATYKASIALRIAEAARRAKAADLAVSSFLPKGYPDVV